MITSMTTTSGYPLKPNLSLEVLNDHSIHWLEKIDLDSLDLAFFASRYSWPPELLEQLSRCGFTKAQFVQIAKGLALAEEASFIDGYQLGKS